MTDTALEPATTEVEEWLARFDQALTAGDAAAAAELFLDDSYWRDLVAFTWNLKTVEGPAGVRDMLDHTLAHTQPRGWAATEPPETGGTSATSSSARTTDPSSAYSRLIATTHERGATSMAASRSATRAPSGSSTWTRSDPARSRRAANRRTVTTTRTP